MELWPAPSLCASSSSSSSSSSSNSLCSPRDGWRRKKASPSPFRSSSTWLARGSIKIKEEWRCLRRAAKSPAPGIVAWECHAGAIYIRKRCQAVAWSDASSPEWFCICVMISVPPFLLALPWAPGLCVKASPPPPPFLLELSLCHGPRTHLSPIIGPACLQYAARRAAGFFAAQAQWPS